MIGLRPKSAAMYLERPRLLRQLPDSGGYVVWLEAPYGYGKSVLTGQWVAMLEAAGWRSLWLSLRGEDPRALLNTALELPGSVPWSLTLETLWGVPTVLVMEDLEGTETLTPVLRNVPGLVLLASRGDLTDPELPRLMTGGALLHLRADDLAFSLPEASALFAGDERAETAWRHSGGWSLPLHLSALTGQISSAGLESLLNGVRDSLDSLAWEALLLLAVLPYLPLSHADDAVRRLSGAGFVQHLDLGYALHPLLAEAVRRHHGAALRRVVTARADALPAELRAEALAGAGLLEALRGLMEREMLNTEPPRTRALEGLLPMPRGPGRSMNLAYAFEHEGRYPEMQAALAAVMSHPEASPWHRLLAAAKALMYVTHGDPPERAAEPLAVAALALTEAEPAVASQYHLNVSVHFVNTLQWEAARGHLERCLELLPAGHAKRPGYERMVRGRLATIRWGEHGDLEGIVRHYAEALGSETLPDTSRLFYLTYRAFYELLRGQNAAAREAALAAEAMRATDPALAFEARAMRAYLDGDAGAFTTICAALPDLSYWNGEWTRTLWARLLRLQGKPEAALEVIGAAAGLFLGCERALALEALGDHKTARAALPESASERFERLYWHAARYGVLRQPSDLEALLGLTLERERVLPFLVPLETLPLDRPELAAAYPLERVLRSGWRGAVLRRQAEIPPLSLTVLDGLSVRLMGRPVNLNGRPWEVLLLSLLGESRASIAAALWPEADPDKARNNLHVTLNSLRKALEPWGQSTFFTEDGLHRTDSDLMALRAALRDGDADAVMRLYRRDLAEGMDLAAVNEERERLRAAVVEALRAAAERAGDPTPYLERVLELEPLHEAALQSLLQTLVHSGRRAVAERHYRHFASRLRREYDLEPDAATRTLLGS